MGAIRAEAGLALKLDAVWQSPAEAGSCFGIELIIINRGILFV
jgi:hypothetical protein